MTCVHGYSLVFSESKLPSALIVTIQGSTYPCLSVWCDSLHKLSYSVLALTQSLLQFPHNCLVSVCQAVLGWISCDLLSVCTTFARCCRICGPEHLTLGQLQFPLWVHFLHKLCNNVNLFSPLTVALICVSFYSLSRFTASTMIYEILLGYAP